MKFLITSIVFFASIFQGYSQPAILVVDSGYTLSEMLEYNVSDKQLEFDALRSIEVYGKKASIATFRYTPYGETVDLIAQLLIPIDHNRFHHITIDTFQMSGGVPEVLAVFTANANKDKLLELIVLCGWHISSYDFSGYLYETFIYKGFDLHKPPQKLSTIKALSPPLIPREAEANRQGERLRAKYNTEAKIRRRLKQLGY